MKIPTWKRLSREDLGSIPPGMGDFLDRILDPINRHMEQISAAFQNSISLADNHNSEVLRVKMTHGVAQNFRLRQLKGKPVDAILTKTEAATAGSLVWSVLERDLVELKVNWATDPGEATLCRIVLLGE